MPPHLGYVWLAGLKHFGGSWTGDDVGAQEVLFPQGVSQDRTRVTVRVQGQAVAVTLWHSPFSLFPRGWHRCVGQQDQHLAPARGAPAVPVEMWELLLPQGQAATVLWPFDLSKSLTWAVLGRASPEGTQRPRLWLLPVPGLSRKSRAGH